MENGLGPTPPGCPVSAFAPLVGTSPKIGDPDPPSHDWY